MRALIQRVSRASVQVAGETVGEIGAGLLILVCAMQRLQENIGELQKIMSAGSPH